MADYLKTLIGSEVTALTNDGRCITGVLVALDHLVNVVLSNTQERIFTRDAPPETVELGLFVLRGDNIAVIGPVSTDVEIDWTTVRGEALARITH